MWPTGLQVTSHKTSIAVSTIAYALYPFSIYLFPFLFRFSICAVFEAQNLLEFTAMFLIEYRPTSQRYDLSSLIPYWSAQSTGPRYNHRSFRARLTHRPDDGSSTFLWNVGQHPKLRTRKYVPEDSELHTRRHENFKCAVFIYILLSNILPLYPLKRNRKKICSGWHWKMQQMKQSTEIDMRFRRPFRHVWESSVAGTPWQTATVQSTWKVKIRE
jgi:hypothetical protein